MINSKNLDLFKTINIIFKDYFGQKSSDYISSYDIISCHIKNTNIYIGCVLLIGTLNHI